MARHGNIRELALQLDGNGLRIGIVQARFNPEIGEAMHDACVSALEGFGVAASDILSVRVPGALEIPLVLQKLAGTGRFDALVALGCVIRGETYHFEIVSNEASAGVLQVSLDAGIPVANGILTVENDAQARARMTEKGADCARVAVEMALLLRQIEATR